MMCWNFSFKQFFPLKLKFHAYGTKVSRDENLVSCLETLVSTADTLVSNRVILFL